MEKTTLTPCIALQRPVLRRDAPQQPSAPDCHAAPQRFEGGVYVACTVPGVVHRGVSGTATTGTVDGQGKRARPARR